MNTLPDVDSAAAAVYAAMISPPPYVVLAQSLLAAQDRAERDALLDAAPLLVQAEALRHVAEPAVSRERDRRLAWLQADPKRIAAVRHYYGHSPEGICDFISDWGTTTNPQLVADGKPATQRFLLFPRQRELVLWFISCWRNSKSGVLTKSRMIGATYAATATLCSLAIFNRGFVGGIASATEAKLDNGPADSGSVFYKLREFMRAIPREFAAGFDIDRTSFDKKMAFPETGSSIVGEIGDKAGRSGRSSFYVVDESAWFDHPGAMDANLAANTKCRIDMSTPRGLNEFWQKATNSELEQFRFHWRDLGGELGFNEAWYQEQRKRLAPHVVASEFDLDFYSSLEGVVISQECVQAMIDLHVFLGIEPSGVPFGGLDVADRGSAKCSFAIRRGILLEHVESWPGGNGGLRGAARRAFALCDRFGVTRFAYDADGMGGPLHADVREINDAREREGLPKIFAEAYRGSAKPVFAERIVPGTQNKGKDYYDSRKSEAWWWFRLCANESLKARNGEPYKADMIISISSKIPSLSSLCSQLSTATASEINGKIRIDKHGSNDTSLVDEADSAIIAFAPRRAPIRISDAALAAHGEPVPGSQSWQLRRIWSQSDSFSAGRGDGSELTAVPTMILGRLRS
jgi:hypothetical protein